MRIPAVIEWKGGSIGWRGVARLPSGVEVTVSQAHNLNTARRRLRKGLEDAGVKDPELKEDVRIPKALAEEVEAHRKRRAEQERLDSEVVEKRIQLGQRLLTELNLSEREVAEWLGISNTQLGNELRKRSTDSSEYTKEAPRKKAPRTR